MKISTSLHASFVCLITLSTASAMNAVTERELRALDPHTRLEQRCDVEAMERLARETRWSPDKVLAYAFSDPKASAHQVLAKGAAFRSKGKWYRLSYECKTDETNMIIRSFVYKTGDLVPRSEWDKHYLVP